MRYHQRRRAIGAAGPAACDYSQPKYKDKAGFIAHRKAPRVPGTIDFSRKGRALKLWRMIRRGLIAADTVPRLQRDYAREFKLFADQEVAA